SALSGREGTDSIEGAHAAITTTLGPVIGAVFAVGLLASGLASTAVGSYAGATIMGGLLKVQIPLLLRRVLTLIPAVVILAVGMDPTQVLVLSQVALSFGIPFALIPLFLLSRDRRVMGRHADHPALQVAAAVSALLVIVLNGVLIWLTFVPGG
ncbi:MAG: Nramp family divalent metal transporter, partial [Arthrobacter sp.]|nr:Nramp family divalent metal transporter [Arthrobacter sp.]